MTDKEQLEPCDCRSYNWQIGTTPEVIVKLPDDSGKDVCLDACIADTVQELWKRGVETQSTCCGHGRMRPHVVVSTDPKECYDILMEIDPRDWEVSRWERVEYNPRPAPSNEAALEALDELIAEIEDPHDIGKRVQTIRTALQQPQGVGLDELLMNPTRSGARLWNDCVKHLHENGWLRTPPPVDREDALRQLTEMAQEDGDYPQPVEAVDDEEVDKELEEILNASDEEIMAWALEEYGSEEAVDEMVKNTSLTIQQTVKTFEAGRRHERSRTPQAHIDVETLAQFIRTIDGNNSMGAGELAERISNHLAPLIRGQDGGVK